VGVIGTGTIAFSAHLPAIRKLRDEIELVAVADVRAEAAATAADMYGAETHYTDYREMLRRERLDFVDICTPEFLHPEQTEAAAEAGLHVLCEKPMASSVAGADRMLRACEAAGVKLMIAHSRRFTGRYYQIRAAIERGEIGEVRYVRENERRPRTMYDRLRLATDHWAPEGDKSWLQMAQYTHGAAMTNAVHETDLARWFVGREPVSVYAQARITQAEGEIPDMVTYTVEFDNGAIAAAEVVNHLPRGYPYFHMMEVIGSEGRLQAIDTEQSPMTVADAGAMTQQMNFPVLLHVDEAYVREIRAFARAVRDDTPLPLDPREARGAIELSAGAVLSYQRGQPVSLPLAEGEDVDG
jgi:predicted dehydrogenase